MKTRTSLALLLAVLVIMALSACINIGGGIGSVSGQGPMVERDFQVAEFTSLNISGAFNITWRESADVSVTVVMQENLFEHLSVSVTGGTLALESERGFSVSVGNTPRLYINSPLIEGISSEGAVTASDWDTVHSQNFTINVEGAANIDLEMEVNTLNLVSAGAANINLTGNVDNANLRIDGAGNVEITVSEQLDVVLNGVGRVRYRGNPVVTRDISGIGTVSRAD